jgi:guanidinoacetate N-methyltransferase
MMQNKKFDDVRKVTYQSRCEIGFLPDFHMWKDEPATFTDEELVIQGHPVMERWEDSYMEVLAGITAQNGGNVLEVGFGMGISAQYIQTHPIDMHIIIEANTDVFNSLAQFAQTSIRPVQALHGFWQDITATLPDESLSGILFDTYPLTEDEIHQNHFTFFAEAYRLLRPGGILTYYSDEINSFSDAHIAKLREAGFRNIDEKVCPVTPPIHCQYWKSNTILAPIITK